jgi:hypothetical protein
MLLKHRCPHTCILNFFTDIEPFMSVGSIIAIGRGRYVWRCHLIDRRSAGRQRGRSQRLLKPLCNY